MPFAPYSIRSRIYLPFSVRRDGYKAFQLGSIYKGHYGEFFDQSIFAINCDHVLGTEAQYSAGLATVFYDGSDFQGITELTRKLNILAPNDATIINFSDYDRVTIIIDTLDRSIVFPDKFLVLKNHSEMDMNGFDITIPGRVDGELNLTGSGSDLNLSGQVEALIVNNSLITINFTGSGSYFDNGVLTT